MLQCYIVVLDLYSFFYLYETIFIGDAMKKFYTYSKNQAISVENNSSSFFTKANDSPEFWKKFPREKKLTDQELPSIVTETTASDLLTDNEDKQVSEVELFTSFQEAEAIVTISNASLEKCCLQRYSEKCSPENSKSLQKNPLNSENKDILTEYINILEHSLLIENVNDRKQSKKTQDIWGHEFQNEYAIQPSPYNHRQLNNDVTTSEYFSNNQLTTTICSAFESKNIDAELTSRDNLSKNHMDIGIIGLQTNMAVEEESLSILEVEPLQTIQTNKTSEASDFDRLENISPIRNRLSRKIKSMPKFRNENSQEKGLKRSHYQRSVNTQIKSSCIKQLTVERKKHNFNSKENFDALKAEMKTLRSTMCSNHTSIKYEEFNSQEPNFYNLESFLLGQHKRVVQCPESLKSRNSTLKRYTNNGCIISGKMQKASKITSCEGNVKKAMPADVEQTLVTVKKKQKTQERINIHGEEKTLIKTLIAPKNSNRVSIKSSVLAGKSIKCKYASGNISNNFFSRDHLKCSTPVNASQYVATNYPLLSSIKLQDSMESPFFLCTKKDFTTQQKSLTISTGSAVSNSYGIQKFIQNEINLTSSYAIKNREENQDFVKLLCYCEHKNLIPFSKAYLWSNLQCIKIGEGSYGEVFSLKNKSEDVKVLKIIPLLLSKGETGQSMSCTDVTREIIICKYMNSLRGSACNSCYNFIKMNKVSCVKGSYPSQLKKAWCAFKKFRGNKSSNLHPGTYLDDQVFIIFEYEFGGQPLEMYEINSASEALSIFHQITMSLTVAEEGFEFEHRDLHLSNILIASTNSECIDYCVEGTSVGVPSFNLLVKIIDFTLSRMTTSEGCVLSADIDEGDSLLLQFGDEQYEIYRKTDRYLGGNWKTYCPYTNIMWLHYILKNMLSRTCVRKAKTDAEKIVLRYLQSIEKELLQYKSAKDYVLKILI